MLPELLRGLSEYRMLIYAIILILMMIFNNGAFFVQFRKNLVNKVMNIFSKNKADKEVI